MAIITDQQFSMPLYHGYDIICDFKHDYLESLGLHVREPWINKVFHPSIYPTIKSYYHVWFFWVNQMLTWDRISSFLFSSIRFFSLIEKVFLPLLKQTVNKLNSKAMLYTTNHNHVRAAILKYAVNSSSAHSPHPRPTRWHYHLKKGKFSGAGET